jgi:hypothetical protein
MNGYAQDVCNLDEAVQLSPYALVYVVSAMLGLCVATLHGGSAVGSKVILSVAVYVTGLIVLDTKQTQSRIARTIGVVSHDALHRLAEELGTISSQMVLGLALLLDACSPGALILDDVLIPKPFARYMCGTYASYDHAQKRHVPGQRLVVLIWSNGVICLPVAVAYWHHRDFVPHYRTKNELARILIYWAVRHHIPCAYLTFDNWYASKQNLRFVARLGLTYVTKLRRNAKVAWGGHRLHVTWFGRFKAHYYGALEVYIQQFPVTYAGTHPERLALVTNDTHAEPGRTKYLLTNALTLTNRQLVACYRRRWDIECFFRTCKQSFGLGACQATRMSPILLHVRMVFLAYTLTQLLVPNAPAVMEQTQTHLRSLHCLRLPSRSPVLVFQTPSGRLQPIPLEGLLRPLRTEIPALQGVTLPSLEEIIGSA